VFRDQTKGALWSAESERRHVFHLVGQRFTLDESRSPGPMRNRLVLIGRNLDHQRLQDQLKSCLADGD
jgi:G3E family GTPase